MKNLLLIFTLIGSFIFNAQAQEGLSANQAKLEEIKAKLSAKGLAITVNDPKKEKAIHPFILKWTNQTLPEFSLPDINGNIIDSKSLRGKYVHINFWSTSCKPCIQEFPELDEIKEKYDQDNVVFLAIAPESSQLVKKIVRKHPLNYIVIADAEGLFDDLGIDGYPKNLFIGQDGVIKKITDGTNYKMELVDEKVKMIPDNFRFYDEVMSKLIK